MEWLLTKKLKKIGRQGNPTTDFVRSLESRLRKDLGHPFWWIQWSKVATATLSIVFLAGSGTGAYAYNSDEVLPDHPLYPVRQSIEKVEETMAVTAQLKQRVRAHLQSRHEKEKRLLDSRSRRGQRVNMEDRRREQPRRLSTQRIEGVPTMWHETIRQRRASSTPRTRLWSIFPTVDRATSTLSIPVRVRSSLIQKRSGN